MAVQRQIGIGLFVLGLLGFIINPLSTGNIITYASLIALGVGLVLLLEK